jgi:hypothetical protein
MSARSALCSICLALSAWAIAGSIESGLLIHLGHAEERLRNGHLSAAYAHAAAVAPDRPLRVRAATTTSEQAEAVRSAIELWCEVLGDHPLELCEEGDGPDVIVVFSPDLAHRGRPVAGLLEGNRIVQLFEGGAARSEVRATVWIRPVDDRGRRLSAPTLRQIAAHEFGHLLGLEDSCRRGSLMGPVDPRRPVSHPSRDEVETLQRVRAAAREVRKQAVLRTLLDVMTRV